MDINIQILPLSDIQSFVYQKCLIPQELFPVTVLPGTLAKCRVSTGAEYICNIFPMTNQQLEDFCWLDNTVKVGSIKSTNNKHNGSLTSLEFLHMKVLPAKIVSLSFKITEKLFEIREEPTKKLLATIAKGLLQPFTFVNNSFINLEELRNLGIAEVRIESDLELFSVTSETDIIVSNVQLQVSDEKHTQLEGMEQPRKELQDLMQGAAIYTNMQWTVKPSLNALVIGPSGCGKTSLCLNFIVENSCNSYIIRSSSILGQYPGDTEAELRRIFNTVKRFVHCFKPNEPMVIVIEDIDLICPSSKNSSSDATNSNRIAGQLVNLLDYLHYSSESSRIIVLATTSDVDAINSALRRPGRFGIEIRIPNLTQEQRGLIFRQMLMDTFYGKEIDLTDELVNIVAKQTQGFVAADLALLVHSVGQEMLRKEVTVQQFIISLERTLRVVHPASVRGSDVAVYKTVEKFDSVGGMDQLKKALEVSVLAGLRQKAAFARFALCLPKGVLLYGPPGCAKTTIAKCLATEANMTFIPTSAAEVYSPYVGNSERYISKIFDTARKNSPCLVFFDEIDSLVGKRALNGKSDIQTRILSTLLTEMDGIGVKLFSPLPGGNNILVVAATNRPEMVDDALLRPGRFDKLIHVPSPDYFSRLQILKIHSGKMPFAIDVDLSIIAKDTENFSGADICSLCNEAAMHAFTQDMNAQYITMEDFRSVLKYQKSSLTQAQIKWYADFERKHTR